VLHISFDRSSSINVCRVVCNRSVALISWFMFRLLRLQSTYRYDRYFCVFVWQRTRLLFHLSFFRLSFPTNRSKSVKPSVVRWGDDDNDNDDNNADEKKKRKAKYVAYSIEMYDANTQKTPRFCRAKTGKGDDVDATTASNTNANRLNDVAWRNCELVLDVGFLAL
jgi:hypothetical protein